ncbi:MAG: hypothetical protein OZSIB_3764 [Candidatus Ozemobacter sibiricus]|uniref:Uncharacterized protein n=1 Tax=Candidatus Ozemobacter sibiricus TaxID=2268124 RepID=A0A367ZP33_9BACT|nr:MAG: hypothetical protein OZSIB_3764 [Candidatus Ozemobacter sibiricus]
MRPRGPVGCLFGNGTTDSKSRAAGGRSLRNGAFLARQTRTDRSDWSGVMAKRLLHQSPQAS